MRVAQKWVPARLELGEGPRIVDGRLVYVDILAGSLFQADLDRPGPARLLASTAPLTLGAVAPVAGRPEEWIAAVGTGVALLSANSNLTWLGRPAEGGIPRRMNDGACDAAGRFWATCMGWNAEPGGGSVFRVDHDGTVSTQIDGLTVPNGPAFTADGKTMFLADSARGLVFRYEFDERAELHDAVEFLHVTDGQPDGMIVDDAGNLWVAIWGAGQIRQYSPSGNLLDALTVPTQQPTAPCLTGPENPRLFVTTAAYGLPAPHRENAGAIYAFDVAASAAPATPFVHRAPS